MIKGSKVVWRTHIYYARKEGATYVALSFFQGVATRLVELLGANRVSYRQPRRSLKLRFRPLFRDARGETPQGEIAKTPSAKAPHQLSPDASVAAASRDAARVLNAPGFSRFPGSSFYRE
jgi:hypothetical protein